MLNIMYSIKLQFLCLDSNVEVYADVNLTTCPLGYVFQTPKNSQLIQGTCECLDIASDDVQCDFALGVACIKLVRKNYVLEDTLVDTAPCQYPYCKTDLPPCPSIGLIISFLLLKMNNVMDYMVDYCVEVVEKMLCLVLKLLIVFHLQIANHGNLMLL